MALEERFQHQFTSKNPSWAWREFETLLGYLMCLYPGKWTKCNSCEIVGLCELALDYLKSLRLNDSKKCCFKEQPTGEETLYHILEFPNGQQHLIKEFSEKQYLEELKKQIQAAHV